MPIDGYSGVGYGVAMPNLATGAYPNSAYPYNPRMNGYQVIASVAQFLPELRRLNYYMPELSTIIANIDKLDEIIKILKEIKKGVPPITNIDSTLDLSTANPTIITTLTLNSNH